MQRKALFLLLPVLALTACQAKTAETKESGTATTVTAVPTTTVKPTTTATSTATATMLKPENTDPDTYEEEISIASPDYTTPKIESKDQATYEDLFNLGNKVSISIDMEDSELEKLEADYETGYKSEIYRHCKSVTITLVNYDNTFTWTYEDVGIRQKGNTSRDTIYSDGKIAGLNHFKLSFDETFDDTEAYGSDAYDWTGKEDELEAREDREFLGLSGLDMKWNKNYDATHIKEIYAAKLYQACGLMSQEIGLTEFEINQTDKNKTYDMGLYTLYEPATKSMIKRHLKDDDILDFGTWKEEKNGEYGVAGSSYGDLYKCSWGAVLDTNSMLNNSVGMSNLTGTYIPRYDRKTNTDVDYDDDQLFNVGRNVSSRNYESIASVMDLTYFGAVEACNYIIGNPDDLRNDMNNLMVYIRRTDGKLVTIPIDNDRCFGITKDWDPDGNGMMYRGVMEKHAAAESLDYSPNIYLDTILSDTDNYSRQVYLSYLKALSESDWMKNETFVKFYNIAKTTYDGSPKSDFWYVDFSLTDTNHTFEEYITNKKNCIDSYFSGSEDQPESDGNYGSVYLIGSFIDWSTSESKNYPMTYNGDGEYTITFTPSKVGYDDSHPNAVKLKLFDGDNYSRIDWTIKDGKLVLDASGSGNSYVLDGVTTSSVVTITVNTLTLEASVVIS